MRLFYIFLLSIAPILSQEVSYDTAFSLYKEGEYAKSVSVIKALHIAGQKTFQSLYLEAHNNIRLNKLQTATDKLEQALLKENNPVAIIDLVKVLLKRGNITQARELAQSSVVTYPENVDLRLIHAMTLYRSKRPKGALQEIEQIKTMGQNIGVDPLLMEAMIYYRLADYEKAEMSLKWVLEIEGENKEALNNLALVLEKLALRSGDDKERRSKLEDARFYLEKAREQDRENQAITGNLERIAVLLNES